MGYFSPLIARWDQQYPGGARRHHLRVHARVEFVDHALRTKGFPAAKILDAGCGARRHAAALAALGHNIELADAAATLLEVATDRRPGARVHQVDLTDFWARSPL